MNLEITLWGTLKKMSKKDFEISVFGIPVLIQNSITNFFFCFISPVLLLFCHRFFCWVFIFFLNRYILSKCRNLIPSFDASRVIHTFSGARAKNTTGDWIIGPVKGVPGFINAASIDSPGIAASPAIAADVVHMLSMSGMSMEKDCKFRTCFFFDIYHHSCNYCSKPFF